MDGTTIESALGGGYEMPDGRKFWVDASVAREMARRVLVALPQLAEAPIAEVTGLLPLVLYFGNEEDREEFVQVIQKAKPGMRAIKLPATR
jgi:hypothetical protein